MATKQRTYEAARHAADRLHSARKAVGDARDAIFEASPPELLDDLARMERELDAVMDRVDQIIGRC